jgi:uncharacterized phiE125 gp8 family phage protein
MNLRLVTAPTSEPVTIIEAREQCRISDGYSDGQLAALILAAREWAQGVTGRAIMEQTWEMSLDEFPRLIELPIAPVKSIESIKYTDTAGAEQTVNVLDYESDLIGFPPRIRSDEAWPLTKESYNAVRVRFVAGYASDHPDLLRFRNAILLHIEAHYDRDEKAMGLLLGAAENLILPLRRWMA